MFSSKQYILLPLLKTGWWTHNISLVDTSHLKKQKAATATVMDVKLTQLFFSETYGKS